MWAVDQKPRYNLEWPNINNILNSETSIYVWVLVNRVVFLLKILLQNRSITLTEPFLCEDLSHYS